MNRDNMECLVKQAIEETISFMKTATPRECAGHQIYVENPCNEEYIRLGFVFYCDWVKPVRVSPSIVHESGFAARRGYYCLEELSLQPEFVAMMMNEYMELLKIAYESSRD